MAAIFFLALDRAEVFFFVVLAVTDFFATFFCGVVFRVAALLPAAGFLAPVFFLVALVAIFFRADFRVAFPAVFLLLDLFTVGFLVACLRASFFFGFFVGGFRVAAWRAPAFFFPAVFFFDGFRRAAAVFLVTFFARDVELDLRRAAVLALAALMGCPPWSRGIAAPGLRSSGRLEPHHPVTSDRTRKIDDREDGRKEVRLRSSR